MMKIKVLELYSGIGGMHYALNESQCSFEVIRAVDINTTANEIYCHNFPKTKLFNKTIESISMKEWNNMNFDMILMSPPCQPFCRIGKQQDMGDERTKSFLFLLDILPRLDKPPSYILLENVKGFDTSESRSMLLTVLESMGYTYQEFLWSPLQFGIPNSRLRYYLIAKRQPLSFDFDLKEEIREDIPRSVEQFLIHRKDVIINEDVHSQQQETISSGIECSNICSSEQAESSDYTCTDAQIQNCKQCENNTEKNNPQVTNYSDTKLKNLSSTETNCLASTDTCLNSEKNLGEDEDINEEESQLEQPFYQKFQSICGTVSDYLEKDKEEEYFEQYLIPEKFFKRFWVMDIVTGESKNTCCFTKRYARHIEGSAIIQMNTQDERPLSYYKKDRIYSDEIHEDVRSRRLRFFSPREIANIMCFPQSFDLPAKMSNIQCYRVLGNSLNVHVVSILIRLMIMGDENIDA